jgi:hypothetical protein
MFHKPLHRLDREAGEAQLLATAQPTTAFSTPHCFLLFFIS